MLTTRLVCCYSSRAALSSSRALLGSATLSSAPAAGCAVSRAPALLRPSHSFRSFSLLPPARSEDKTKEPLKTEPQTKSDAPKVETAATPAPKAGDKTAANAAANATGNAATTTAVAKPPLSERIKKELQHYWAGTKLLGLDIKISCRLLIKMGTGYELTRREYRLLQQTTSDVVRLFPFAFFVLVPFAELLLPIALKLFPNLLPSTYESKPSKEKKRAILKNSRIKVSSALRSSMRELKLPSDITDEQKSEFKNFVEYLREGRPDKIPEEQVLRVAKIFKDDLILDNLSKPVLVSMCKFMNMRPFGSDGVLRYLIRHRLVNIKADDMLLDYEGVNSLSDSELQLACSSRGIRSDTATPEELRKRLAIWIDLRLHQRLPYTVGILSNAYMYSTPCGETNFIEALKAVLAGLPDEFYHAQELHVDDADATFNQRIGVVKEQEKLIKAEAPQEKDHVVQVKDKLNIDDDGEIQKRVGKQVEKEAQEEKKKEKQEEEKAEKAEATASEKK